jgi:hypothetical protein
VDFEVGVPPESISRQVNRKVVEVASQLLASGRQEAERRRACSRNLSGAGMACAMLAVACGRSEVVSRRSFLQRTLHGAAIASLTPGVGYSVVSELLVPGELEAFDEAAESLDRLAGRIPWRDAADHHDTVTS